jgi:hypothetical protein
MGIKKKGRQHMEENKRHKTKNNDKNEKQKVKFAKPTKEKVTVIDGGEVIVNKKGDYGNKKREDNIWRKIKDTKQKTMTKIMKSIRRLTIWKP